MPLGPEEGARLEPWRPTVLKLYLPQDETLRERQRQIETAIASVQFEVVRSDRSVQEEDWAESWKQFFQVEHVGRGIVIRPTWRDYDARPGEIVLDLDPGMAFGTGQHPTTRLCLTALEQLAQPGIAVLDLGCGSGILSLAAVKLGCAAVIALDLETVAVEATRANARLNQVADRIRAERGSLGERWPLADDQQAIADVILANISATALVELAPLLAEALRPDGLLVGSGVVRERTDEVLVALAAAGLRTERLLAEAGWSAIVARRP